jgi:two-component system KDP operon response regulator KdpE
VVIPDTTSARADTPFVELRRQSTYAPDASKAPGPLVLLIEDDRRLRRDLRAALCDQNLRVVDTETGADGLAQAAARNPDLIIASFMLPDMNGIQITTKLREWTGAPILILSAPQGEWEKVASLDAGANDFVTKPFVTRELLARVRVWLRHLQRVTADSLSTVIEVGELSIDLARRLAFVAGEEVRLTPTQYKLFCIFMRNSGKILTHEQLLFLVWGPAYTQETQYLRVYVGQLRQKLERDPAHPRYLVTEPGVGYRLRPT